MKGITNETIKNDLRTIETLLNKYNNAIWESQEGQKAHYDKQSKFVRIVMCDVRSGLFSSYSALNELSKIKIDED